MRVDDERCPQCHHGTVEVLGPGLLEKALLAMKDGLGARFVCHACGHTWQASEGSPWRADRVGRVPEPEIDEDALEARWAARFGPGDGVVEG
ncbi:MAG: hypothetical protein JWO22_3833 [Frankiales bacterium]|nr:hypothetical protein [Frankiales bacterium]